MWLRTERQQHVWDTETVLLCLSALSYSCGEGIGPGLSARRRHGNNWIDFLLAVEAMYVPCWSAWRDAILPSCWLAEGCPGICIPHPLSQLFILSHSQHPQRQIQSLIQPCLVADVVVYCQVLCLCLCVSVVIQTVPEGICSWLQSCCLLFSGQLLRPL